MKTAHMLKIVKNIEIAPSIYEMELEKSCDMESIQAGQFLHIRCQKDGLLLRRPISISYTDEKVIGMVIRCAGRGTKELCKKKAGEYVDVLGPLGNGFDPIDEKRIVIVGGGIGTAPLLELCKRLSKEHVTVLLGFRDHPYLIEKFKEYAKEVLVSTEDGSVGHKGYVTDDLKKLMDEGIDYVYACGPEIMLKKVQSMCDIYHIKSQLSIEERMACGVGACLVCTCEIKAKEEGTKFVRTCKEGPVFKGDEVVFHD